MEREKKTLNLLHEKDLLLFLDRHGIRERFEEGKVRCKLCGELMNAQNIYSFFKESGSIAAVCDKPECVTNFLRYLDEKRKTKTER